MKIHHLNCGSFCPLNINNYLAAIENYREFGKANFSRALDLIHGVGNKLRIVGLKSKFESFINEKKMAINWDIERAILADLKCGVSHCLLLEGKDSLTLVDTGIGKKQITENLDGNLTWTHKNIFGFSFSVKETAIEQIKNLGYSPEDVRNIFITHLDFDHAGGIPDFPWATLHVSKKELSSSKKKWSIHHKRFCGDLWKNHIRIQAYDSKCGENLDSLLNAQSPYFIGEDIYLIPLPGHTLGHFGFYLKGNNILFAGDSFLHHSQLEDEYDSLSVKIYNSISTMDHDLYNNSLKNLKEIKRRKIQIINSHDPHYIKPISSPN